MKTKLPKIKLEDYIPSNPQLVNEFTGKTSFNMDTLELKKMYDNKKISKELVRYMLHTHQINTIQYLTIIWND